MKKVYKISLVCIMLLMLVACNKQTNNNLQISTTDTSEEEMTTDGSLNDLWIYNSSTNPIDVVRSAIESQKQKEYTLKVEVREVVADEQASETIRQMYIGSDLALKNGWTDTYLQNNMIVVFAEYYIEYNHEKTFLDDGEIKQYFILLRNADTQEWSIWNNIDYGQIN